MEIFTPNISNNMAVTNGQELDQSSNINGNNTLNQTKALMTGNYTLSIGTKCGDLTYSKMVELVVD